MTALFLCLAAGLERAQHLFQKMIAVAGEDFFQAINRHEKKQNLPNEAQ
jgi:hypothetical protein